MASLDVVLMTAATLGGGLYLDASWTLLALTWTALFLVQAVAVPLLRNWRKARRSGLPWLLLPFDPHYFLWMVVQVPLRPVLQRWMPRAVWSRLALACPSWEFHERQRPYLQFAAPQGNVKSLMVASLGTPQVYTWDVEVVSQILARPRDFQVSKLTEFFMDRFGKNLVTSNGDMWSRQRKIIASVINEKISKAVFRESIRHTEGLVAELFAHTVPGQRHVDTNRLFDMLRKVTIHVLSGAGMGESVPWQDTEREDVRPGFHTSYITACKSVTNAVAGPIILPQWFLDHYPSFLPGHRFLRELGHAIREFPVHTKELLDKERLRSAHGGSGGATAQGNIMSQLLQASSKSGTMSLQESEIMGNLFIFTVAGFDTTANTLSYAMVLLARYPQWQDWLIQEIDEIVPPCAGGAEALDYTDVFPRASRVLAFMLETLRHFSPIIQLVRQANADHVIQTSKGTYWIPKGCELMSDSVGLHLDPDVWRNLNLQPGEQPSANDEAQFRPTRWLNPPASSTKHFQPPRGTFIPWSVGPRVCPGQRMAQVEFVAVLMMLLRQHRIEVVPVPGESRLGAERRLDARMRKSHSLLTLQMEGIYDVADSDQGFSLRIKKRFGDAAQ